MRVTDVATLGREIRKRRKTIGYTQKYIADFTGFSISFISDIERGKPTAEIGKVLYLINVLGMDVELNAREDRC